MSYTKPCPECKKTLIASIDFNGTGTMNIKCPYCKCLVEISLTQKPSVTLTKIVVTIIIVVTLAGIPLIHGKPLIALILN